jgi:D-amino-acid oxidase
MMAAVAERVVVVGAGVVGLSCAVRLAEAGFEVEVVARDAPLDTTSAVAAAIWYPYRAFPYERVLGWSRTTFAELASLAATEAAAGIRMRWGLELLRRADPPLPWWSDAVPDLEVVEGAGVPAGYRRGWRFRAPVVDMPRYLPWLEARLARAGGRLTSADVEDLAPLGSVVVNCAGLGARELAGDPTVEPLRGQVVVVEQVGMAEWVIDDTDPAHPTYVVPRTDEIVLGGTDDAGVWDLAPDPAVAESILRRAGALVPQLAGARVIRHRVGLRPVRPSVRLEPEQRPGQTVVHCYGHGGSGVTLSWGCADEVLGLIRSAAERAPGDGRTSPEAARARRPPRPRR